MLCALFPRLASLVLISSTLLGVSIASFTTDPNKTSTNTTATNDEWITLSADNPKEDNTVPILLKRIVGSASLLGELVLGTPPKRYLVEFDTGSSTLWLFGKQAKPTLHIANEFAGDNANLFQHTFYSAENSRSYSPWYGDDGLLAEMGIIYGDGDIAEGEFASETLQIGSYRIENMAVGIAEKVAVTSGITGYDGVFGLGLMSENDGVPPPLTQMMADKHVFGSNNKIYSLYFALNGRHGEVILGGTNRKRFTGQLKYAPRVSMAETGDELERWVIAVGHTPPAVGNGRTEAIVGHGLVDSGTNTIDVPGTVLDTLKADIEKRTGVGLVTDEESGFLCYYHPGCKNSLRTLPKLKFTIDGRPYTVLGSDYFTVEASGVCVLMVVEQLGPYWILGEPFLKSYYTVFDFGNDQIGFARANHQGY